MPPFTPGAIERPRDDRDVLLGAVQAPTPRPATFLPDCTWMTRNYQGHTTFCGEHAAAHLKAILDRQQDPPTAPRYSPRYGVIKLKTPGPLNDTYSIDAGTDMRSIFKWLQKAGVAKFEPLENDVTLSMAKYCDASVITPAIDADAAQSLIASYAFGGTDFNSLCGAIYQNGAVLLLIKCDDGFWGTTTPTFTLPTYGHFIVANGYDANHIRIIDSAEPNNAFAVKMIAKQYITQTFIKESGTALDMPLAQVKQIIQTTAQTVQAIETSPAPVAQKQAWYAGIAQALQSLLAIFSQEKVGSASPNMNTTTNVFLLTAATTLVGLGIATIATQLWPGVIEFALGIVAFVAYEKFPASVPPQQ